MIIKIHASGRSFKGLVRYLGHDPKAETKERVAWTHTLNTASDLPSLAMHEIYWTYKAADELKREAGVRRGGRRLEAPVKHFSLSWSPDDEPSQAHMIATVESFLKHMRWSEHQAILFAHDDTAHPHVHVVLNAVHPETGRKLDERNDWERAEPWGLAYEIAQGEVRCKQRLEHPHERTPTPTRATWHQLRAYERESEAYELGRVSREWDYFDRKSPEERRDKEWQVLKEHQKHEREAFFANGKQVYRDVSQEAYQKVRAAFRPEWKEFYAAVRDGQDKADLERMKSDILARQKAALDREWSKGSKAKRAERDQEYAAINGRHRDERAELRIAQEQGRSHAVLEILAGRREARGRETDQSRHGAKSASLSRETRDALRIYEARAADREQRKRDYLDRAQPNGRAGRERTVLREGQRGEREAFYGQGKGAIRDARRQARDGVKAELRPTFNAIRQARASGLDRTQLAGLRFIKLRQLRETSDLKTRIAALTAKEQRKRQSNDLSEHHRAERRVLRRRNLAGLRSYRVVDPDRALIGAAEAVKQAQAKAEAKQKEWRQSRQEPPTTMASHETDAARFKAAILGSTERAMKTAEFEDRVKMSWRRLRPGPGRGRD